MSDPGDLLAEADPAPDPWAVPSTPESEAVSSGAAGVVTSAGHLPSDALLEPAARHELTEHVQGDYQVSSGLHRALDAERGLAETVEQSAGFSHAGTDARIGDLEQAQQQTAARTVADTQAVDHWDIAHPGVHAAAEGVHNLGLDPVVQAGEDLVGYGEQAIESFMPSEQPDGS